MKPQQELSIKNSIATKLLKIVFGLYFIIAIGVTLAHIFLEYRYQKNNIQQELIGLQKTFEQALGINIWHLNHESLISTLEGMLNLPAIAGVKIEGVTDKDIAIGGIIVQNGITGDVDMRVNLLGIEPEESIIHDDKKYNYDVFTHTFPILYTNNKKIKQLGKVTLYSNTSVVFQRVKLGFLLLVVNAFLKTAALWIIFLWISTLLLRKPLEILTKATASISMDNLGSFSVDTKTSDRNEIKLLEETMTSMVSNLHVAIVKQKKSEKKYKTLFEKSHDAIFIVEKKTGKYIDANESALKLTGRSWPELNSLTTNDICPEELENRLEEIKESEISHQLGQTVYIKPDGERRTAILVSIPLNHDMVIGIARDITEEMELNERLKQSQKMEAIGTLAGGIAHDFNNILSAILGYSGLVKLDNKKPEKVIQHIDQVEKGAKRAAELVQQILTFSRRTEYQKHHIKLFAVVNETLKLLRSSIPTSIEIIKKLNSKSNVFVDSTRIHQVVMNLCTNSYHAMRTTGGILTVALTEVDILRSKYLWDKKIIPGEYLKLEVSDTGIGMKKNELEKVFEPYFTTKKPGQGTGLGLALVKAIVDEHDGFLDIYSKPGTGTSFYIYLPRIKKNTDHTIFETRTMDQYRGNETILIVDDEEPIRESCCAFLKSMGYHVDTCTNGKDGLKKIKKNTEKYDMVVTDLAMPGLTGDKLVEKILKILPELPIILWTGYSDDITETKATELGIRKLLQKPVSNHDLLVLLREIFNNLN